MLAGEPMSSFSRSKFGDSGYSKVDDEVEHVLKQIQTLDTSKAKALPAEMPEVVSRLLQNDNEVVMPRARSKNTKHARLRKKTKEIREVKKVVSILDAIPSAAHYRPNFSAVLSKAPAITLRSKDGIKLKDPNGYSGLSRLVESKPRESNLDSQTMNEMIKQWSTEIRDVRFTKQKTDKQSTAQISTRSISTISETTSSTGFKLSNRSPGLLEGSAKRDSYLPVDVTPAPTDYDVDVQVFSKSSTVFAKQASRRPISENMAHIIRDVRSDIDKTKKTAPRAISFDKQSTRFAEEKKGGDVWDEIKEEQEQLISELVPPAEEKQQKERQKIEPFSQQTTYFDKHPFKHLMRQSPDPQLMVEKSRIDTSKTFDISQPSVGRDRSIINKTEAPDIIYDGTECEWKMTKPRCLTPALDKRMDRKSPYYYMPKPCGKGEALPPSSCLARNTAVDIKRMGKRKMMLSVPADYGPRPQEKSFPDL